MPNGCVAYIGAPAGCLLADCWLTAHWPADWLTHDWLQEASKSMRQECTERWVSRGCRVSHQRLYIHATALFASNPLYCCDRLVPYGGG